MTSTTRDEARVLGCSSAKVRRVQSGLLQEEAVQEEVPVPEELRLLLLADLETKEAARHLALRHLVRPGRGALGRREGLRARSHHPTRPRLRRGLS